MKKRDVFITMFFLCASVLVLSYRFFTSPPAPVTQTGVHRAVTVHIAKHSFAFDPELIDADQGDILLLKVINDDDVPHGIQIDGYGIAQTVEAHSRYAFPAFLLTNSGDFLYYESVFWGEGVAETGKYKGQQRGRFDMQGVLRVRAKKNAD